MCLDVDGTGSKTGVYEVLVTLRISGPKRLSLQVGTLVSNSSQSQLTDWSLDVKPQQVESTITSTSSGNRKFLICGLTRYL